VLDIAQSELEVRRWQALAGGSTVIAEANAHVRAASAPPGSGTAADLPVPLAAHLNNVGVTSARDTANGAFNVWGNSFAAEHLPPSGPVVVDGVWFDFPAVGTGEPDNVRCEGQLVDVAPGAYDWLYVLAAAERRAEDELALHFERGEVDFEALRVSDFWASEAAFGERIAFESPVMHYPRHVQPNVSALLWLQRVPVTRRATLAAIRLPRNVAVHVFALTLRRRREVER
jgi:hypothetical protein